MRIIVNQLKNIGDMVLGTAAIGLLRQVYPDAHIAILVRPYVAPFFENHPLIDEVVSYDYKGQDKGLTGMGRMIRRIRQGKYDVSISLESRMRPALMMLLAGVPVRVAGDGMDRYGHKRPWYMCTYTDCIPITTQEREHQSETFMKVIRGWLQLPPEREAPLVMPPPDSERVRKMATLIHKKNGRKKFLFCIRGTWEGKNWPIENFCTVTIQNKAKLYFPVFAVYKASSLVNN